MELADDVELSESNIDNCKWLAVIGAPVIEEPDMLYNDEKVTLETHIVLIRVWQATQKQRMPKDCVGVGWSNSTEDTG